MDPTVVGYGCVALLLVLLFVGVPVGVSMAVSGILGMYFGANAAFVVGQLTTLPYAVSANYAYAVLPLFVLMGVLADLAGITDEVFRAADAWLRRIRGGLYQAVVVGSAIFAAINGSTIVNAVVFTRVAYPEMVKYGYDRALSIGCIAATGSFAAMIPPSITMVIYAIITEQSVGQILIAGIIPGALTAVVYMVGLALLVRWKPELAPRIRERIPLRKKLATIRWLWPVAFLITLVLGGIYTGVFPPSAAGAVGAFGVFLVYLVRKGTRDFKSKFVPLLIDAAAVSCIIFIILIGGLIFSRMLVVLGLVDGFVSLITGLAGSPLQFMILTSILYMVLGCFLDTTSMMVVTLPFVFPVVQHFQIDPIWFGIVLVKLVEISVITPPVGMNLFAVMSAVDEDTKFGHVVRGCIPFIGLELLVLGLLIAYPELSTWLPQQMLAK